MSGTRKPESELAFRDHAPQEITGPVTVGRASFAVGDTVSGPDRFGRTITGPIIRQVTAARGGRADLFDCGQVLRGVPCRELLVMRRP